MTRPDLDELMEFPGSFTFRVVLEARDGLPEECRGLVESILGRPITHLETRRSAGGRWCVVRLQALVEVADELRAVYAALGTLDGLQMLL